MSRWEPIATAPSGRAVLGWAPSWGGGPEVIFRKTPDEPWQEVDEHGDYICLGFEPEWWMDWRPLPGETTP